MSIIDTLLEMGYKLEDIPNLDLLEIFPYVPEYPKDVYLSLTGQLIPRCHLKWVENINLLGMPYSNNITIIYDNAVEITKRMGEPEDYALELRNLMDAFTENEEIIAYKMFKYGMKYQQMLDSGTLNDGPDQHGSPMDEC